MISKNIPYPQIPLFEQIRPDHLKAVLGCLGSFTRAYQKGEIIIMEQEQVAYVGIVLRGAVHMLKEDIWGNQTLLAYMVSGELFGEVFAVQKENRARVTFVAAQESEVLFLSPERIIHSCQNNCEFHQQLTTNMFHLLGQKSVNLMEKIEVSSKSSLRDKILSYLSIQAQKQNSRYITVPLNRQEMAQFLGANRSAMTRTLCELRDEGVLDFDRNTFVLKK